MVIGYYGNYLNNQWNYDHIYKSQLDAERDRTTTDAGQKRQAQKEAADRNDLD